jgi:hypothetical protein
LIDNNEKCSVSYEVVCRTANCQRIEDREEWTENVASDASTQNK